MVAAVKLTKNGIKKERTKESVVSNHIQEPGIFSVERILQK